MSRVACALAFAATVGAGAPGTVARGDSQVQAVRQIERYCVTSWRRAGIARQDWSDCTQDALARLLTRVPPDALAAAIEERESWERRELHRAIWRQVKRWRRARRFVPQPTEVAAMAEKFGDDVLPDGWEPAWHSLADSQREILRLWSEGWRISQIAQKLGISPARASDEKYKGLAKLRAQLGVDSLQPLPVPA